jgi:cytidyltransferase-like protein
MYAKFEHKIKTPQQLAELVGRRPRRRRVIMCHGTFDIVHPGHMRHLMYAKEKAGVLVVSVTADEHISKGPYRPYVPQELRAANLAAFEFVDYVVIDRNATPIENIGIIQPDFFAKGFEYQTAPLPPKTEKKSRARSVRRRDGVHPGRRRVLVDRADHAARAQARDREAGVDCSSPSA